MAYINRWQNSESGEELFPPLVHVQIQSHTPGHFRDLGSLSFASPLWWQRRFTCRWVTETLVHIRMLRYVSSTTYCLTMSRAWQISFSIIESITASRGDLFFEMPISWIESNGSSERRNEGNNIKALVKRFRIKNHNSKRVRLSLFSPLPFSTCECHPIV